MKICNIDVKGKIEDQLINLWHAIDQSNCFENENNM